VSRAGNLGAVLSFPARDVIPLSSGAILRGITAIHVREPNYMVDDARRLRKLRTTSAPRSAAECMVTRAATSPGAPGPGTETGGCRCESHSAYQVAGSRSLEHSKVDKYLRLHECVENSAELMWIVVADCSGFAAVFERETIRS
jgi:hypothetical protein